MKGRCLENDFVSLAVDAAGRIVSLVNKVTRTELVTCREAAEAWRMIVPTGRHTVDIIRGSRHGTASVELVRGRGERSLVVSARVRGVRARFLLSLADDLSRPQVQILVKHLPRYSPSSKGVAGELHKGDRVAVTAVLLFDTDNFRYYLDLAPDGAGAPSPASASLYVEVLEVHVLLAQLACVEL